MGYLGYWGGVGGWNLGYLDGAGIQPPKVKYVFRDSGSAPRSRVPGPGSLGPGPWPESPGRVPGSLGPSRVQGLFLPRCLKFFEIFKYAYEHIPCVFSEYTAM